MGITKFYGDWLSKVPYPNVIIKNPSRDIEGISIDMNGLLHATAQEVYCYGNGYNKDRVTQIKNYNEAQLEAEYHIFLKTRLENLFQHFHPKQYVLFCVDGVAPQAKINQQRIRRFRPSPPSPLGIKPDFTFNPVCITPGTEFMHRLDLFLNAWLASIRELLPLHIVYSSHRCPGEGEHKMFRWLRDLLADNKINQGTGQHIVYGLDADLTMLSILSPIKNIILCRENLYNCVSIDALVSGIHNHLDNSKPVDVVSRDFVIMVYLIGNDFIPHLPSLGGVKETMDLMFNCYRELGHPLNELSNTNDYMIKWDSFTNFIILLAQKENQLLINKATKNYRYPFTTLINNISRKLSNDKSTYVVTNFNFDKFRNDWYKNPIPISNNIDNDVTKLCLSYLKSISWVFGYYQGLDVSKHHSYPYQFGPLLLDLAITAAANINNTELNNIFLSDSDWNIGIVHQLLSVIPSKYSDLINSNYSYLINTWGNLIDLCPNKFPLFYEGKDEDWESIPILPFSNMNRVKMEVDIINETLLPVYYKEDKEILSYKGVRILIPGKKEFRKPFNRQAPIPQQYQQPNKNQQQQPNRNQQQQPNRNQQQQPNRYRKNKISTSELM